MAKQINISGKIIGTDSQVFIIAEAGVNHNGDIDTAFKLIDAAKDANVDAVKLQTFKTESLVEPNVKKAEYQVANTGTSESQFEMLKKLELSYDDFVRIKDYTEKKGLIFLSTPFDFESVDLLESISVDAYKISSSDVNNPPFLKYIAEKNKPIILSTGMTTLGEVIDSVNYIKLFTDKLALLHCTTNYPVAYEDVNMNILTVYNNIFDFPVGYSDHTNGIEIPVMAVSMGATIIEKHFTLDKNMIGPDHKASLEPDELKAMVKSIRNVEKAFGEKLKALNSIEKANRVVMQKSLVVTRDIIKGETLSGSDIAIKRPGDGISPKYYDDVIGKKCLCNIEKGIPLKWSYLE